MKLTPIRYNIKFLRKIRNCFYFNIDINVCERLDIPIKTRFIIKTGTYFLKVQKHVGTPLIFLKFRRICRALGIYAFDKYDGKLWTQTVNSLFKIVLNSLLIVVN